MANRRIARLFLAKVIFLPWTTENILKRFVKKSFRLEKFLLDFLKKLQIFKFWYFLMNC